MFGTDNLGYGAGLGDDDFGAGGTSLYDEYTGDAYASDDLEIGDYLYEYDPLKEQNLLADYMSGLVDFGDKTEGVRNKAIAERKALSKSVRGGLTSGTIESMEEAGMDASSKAQAALYRNQASSKRALGENIGSLRETYESDLAEGVEKYNAAIGEGMTESDAASTITDYADNYGVDDPNGSKKHAIAAGNPSGDYAISNSTDPNYNTSGDDDHEDTWLNKETGIWYRYSDPNGIFGRGDWKNKGAWS